MRALEQVLARLDRGQCDTDWCLVRLGEVEADFGGVEALQQPLLDARAELEALYEAP